jgi:hypothetical protein
MGTSEPPAKRKTQQPQYLQLNGVKYQEGSKCPACSSEVDKGGRLHFKQKKNWYLKCERCKYLIETERVRNKRENYLESRRKKRVLVKEGFGRRKKNLKITKKMAKEIQRQRMMLKRRKELEAIAERDTEEMNERFKHLIGE